MCKPKATKNIVLSQEEQKRGFCGAPNKGYWLETVQDFLCKLDMKPQMHALQWKKAFFH